MIVLNKIDTIPQGQALVCIEKLAEIALVKQSRLSVMPIKKVEWDIIIKISL